MIFVNGNKLQNAFLAASPQNKTAPMETPLPKNDFSLSWKEKKDGKNPQETGKITTDFDRLIGYILEHKQAPYGKISKDLGIPWKMVDECCTILKLENKVEIIYPPWGDPICRVVGFVPEKWASKWKKGQ